MGINGKYTYTKSTVRAVQATLGFAAVKIPGLKAKS